METFGRTLDEKTVELLLVVGGAVAMALLTLVYLV
jgi:hypothetical protein